MDERKDFRAPAESHSWRKALFEPETVALVGASRDPQKWGFNLLFNVVKGGFPGRIYPVNRREKEILGIKTYPSIAEIPEALDLAILVVPPSDILKVIRECGKNGAKVGVVITAGFGEVDPRGKGLEKEMTALAGSMGMRLMGPNCQGIVSLGERPLYAHMPPQFPRSGPVGVVSQSGNLATSLIEMGINAGLGFSRVISSGNEADLRTPEFLDALAEDDGTEVILSYLEGVRDGREFAESARKASGRKPVLMVKGGQTEEGRRAAFSHTGALAGSDALYDGLLKQAGIIRAETIEEMIDMASAFTTQPLPRGRKVGIITLGGGWGVLAADYCAKAGLIIGELPGSMVEALNQVLPPWWNRINPVDMVAGYRKGDLNRSMELFLGSDRFDGVILLGLGWRAVRGGFLKSWSMGAEDRMEAAGEDWIDEEERILGEVRELGRRYGKPVLLASDVIRHTPGMEERVRKREAAAYPTLFRAVKAYLGLVKRYESLARK